MVIMMAKDIKLVFELTDDGDYFVNGGDYGSGYGTSSSIFMVSVISGSNSSGRNTLKHQIWLRAAKTAGSLAWCGMFESCAKSSWNVVHRLSIGKRSTHTFLMQVLIISWIGIGLKNWLQLKTGYNLAILSDPRTSQLRSVRFFIIQVKIGDN